MQPRISQRQSLACRECTRRKRKCDKAIPCARCTRLGLHCDREVVYLRRHISQNGAEIAFLTSLRDDLQQGDNNSPARAVQRLTERIAVLQSGHEDDGSSTASPGSVAAAASERASWTTPGSAVSGRGSAVSESGEAAASDGLDGPGGLGSDSPGSDKDSLIVTALEHVAWGRNSGGCYPHRRCACQHHRSWSELSSINGQSSPFQSLQVSAQTSPVLAAAQLPPRPLAEMLVDFHLGYMAWHHNCLHGPTFQAQCRVFWDTGQCDQLQWVALYCAVVGTALFCLQHSDKYRRQQQAAARYISARCSAPALFQTMTDVLYESHFLQNLSLYAVQAVVVSTEVAHNLGRSQLNATLISAAIRIAECLGVHKIRDERPEVPLADTVEWHERLEREVGRRVWLQMVIQDHFAIPFTDAYGIHPAYYSTGAPLNADDHDLVPRPDDVPTISTYTRVLATIARLMPELADGMGPLQARKPLAAQYDHILAMDRKMRHVVRAIPRFLLQPDPALEARIPWLAIARQSLAITSAEKIIMIHRPFLFRSFQSSAYAHTRRTCVSAAVTILREHKSIVEAGELSLWTHTAFCITAALILCFEIMFQASDGDAAAAAAAAATDPDPHAAAQRALYAAAIDSARAYLASRVDDVLAQRGVLLIRAVIPDAGARVATVPPRAAAIHFDDVVSRFALDWALLGLHTDTQRLPPPPLPPTPVLPPALPLTAADLSDLPPDLGQDFDAWFQDIFSVSQGGFS